ncbi:molybdopterin guanine dinucleotide-containing S/N-oxide reductase [Pseudomonas capsici]|uniref:Molybdopterin guanine dinucleotide-containing S/N-oxide reductase n=1 Tax=Pseudomonas capsici TaxID=2810614 RepID=A0ABT3C474_9PSED|nr:molybdopterin guanine dinucleotide-containing S/N-oxide reductase [Pseudomonas capsici]MBN6716250.1 molybdopterin guanine dinucleotide-containing S/N-oxide reductase [Pseudomonas capsici]MBN6721179.1 molybdopterin guanine dinucleotide-containing S/N-oxide reductase [Pseudomonas capsici]MBN6727263.1 molybdopterin guanine dinucleotide-containing S/N-oxide reductase [Pseudomonas capsici]MCV4270917.1 molybdopterin guanine dinucleotide-containing S/N-oxide reductase [Pseudomonas capsici]MCV42799
MTFTSLHWGVYRPQVVDGQLEALVPAEWDKDPSPIGDSVAGAIASPTRIKRPAVRRSFLHESGGRPDLRGQEPFVEVSWDVALDLVARELRRIKNEHGNQAIFGGSYGWGSAGRFHHAQSQLHRFLNCVGGYVFSTDSYSLGAGRVLMPHIVGNMDWLLAAHTSWKNLAEHCELFVAFGGLPAKNAQTSPGGASDHLLGDALQAMSKAGVEFVNVSPLRDDLAGPEKNEWLAIRPGSDTALMMALSWVLITRGLHDEAFVQRYTVGYERFRDYLLGHVDGQPKDPHWAEKLTGIAARQITELAQRMASKRTMINVAYSLQRSIHGEQPFWMTVTLAALLGQIGLPGGGFGLGYGCMNNTGSGRKAFSGPRFEQGSNPVKDFIPVARVADMLLNPGAPFDYNGQQRHYPDIRLVYWAGGNIFHHHQDLNRLLDAWQRPETIIVHEQYWTAQARYADIVLPATTALERNDIGSAASDRFMIAMQQAIAPVGEARDDYSILADLAQRMGVGDSFTEGRDASAWLRHIYEQSRERAETFGVQLPDYEQFWRDGLFEVQYPETDMILLKPFRDDPQANPLPTPSGRIEIFSERIAGFGYADCPGHPVCLDKPASSFPLHLLSNQPRTRLHSQYDHGACSRASKIHEREPLTLNRSDAQARGVSDGDVVKVFNERGAFLAGVIVSDDIRPGVVQIATGAWFDPLVHGQRGSLEKHGNPNMITLDVGASSLSQGCAAQTASVEIVRWDGELPEVTAFEPPLLT